ncbi:MAG: cytochrome P450, partial [Alphaproteobacteria bacterium]|nr:cytochrome P450 [Alphaproteobacteria bacterium]MDX5415394.1 cytochrome P450 [Alphaproteobacteria bacterium]MDX5492611.1 cytochrome P450 [Alphaproteobacteria bacterium]
MSDAAVKYEIDEAREQAYSTPLDEIDVGRPELFKTDTMWPYFERLR